MKTLLAIALLALVSVTANAQKVKVISDPAADFSKYKTYAWDQGTLANPIVKQHIVTAVDNALAAKGLKRDDSNPDLIVAAVTAITSDLTMTNPSWAPSLNSLTTGVYGTSTAWPVSKGTLVIDISDARSKNNLWRGSATQTLEHGPSGDRVRDAKSVQKPIYKAVEKMFKQFPPGKK